MVDMAHMVPETSIGIPRFQKKVDEGNGSQDPTMRNEHVENEKMAWDRKRMLSWTDDRVKQRW